MSYYFVCNITYYENDGQVVRYLSIALRNRYLELYKSSRKQHDCESVIEEDEELLEKTVYCKNEFVDVIFYEDASKIIHTYTGIKQDIAYLIIMENLSDLEIAEKLKLSRQYINRIRRTLRKQFSLQNEDS